MSAGEVIRRAALGLLGASGAARLARGAQSFCDRALVLAYHSVAREPDYASAAITVDPDVFDAQIAHLVRHYRVAAFAHVVDALAAGQKLPDRTVAITFDDGYLDNVEIAAPILARHGATATFFVTADPVLDGAPFWVGRLEQATHRALRYDALTRVLTLDAAPQTAEGAFNAVAHRANVLCGQDRLQLIDAAMSALAEDGGIVDAPPDSFMMGPEDLRRLQALNMDVGAHSCSHPILTALPDEEALAELSASRLRLEAALDAPVTSLAYPNGRGVPSNYDRRIINLARKAGFVRATTSQRGPASMGLDPMAVSRVAVNARLGLKGFIWKLESALRCSAPAVVEDAGLVPQASPALHALGLQGDDLSEGPTAHNDRAQAKPCAS